MLFHFYCLQKQCIDFVVNAAPLDRYVPRNQASMQYRVWTLVNSTPFDFLIMTIIALNTVVLMTKVGVHALVKQSYLSGKACYMNIRHFRQMNVTFAEVTVEKPKNVD